MRHSLTLAAVAAATIALLAGCGSSSTTSTTSTSAAASAASTATTAPAAAPGVVIATKHAKPGTVLVAGTKNMTVYLFEADKSPSSTCSGACAQVWPPVTSAGTPSAGGGVTAADIGLITRADGTRQVTYKGHPLYFYVKDKDAEDAYGQGVKSFGASWYVLAPSGAKIDPS